MLAKHLVKQGLLLKNAGVLSRAAYHGSGVKVTMNDLPVPQGDWKEHHSRQNSKYNAVLFAGVAALVGTIALAKSTGIIFLNYSPPQSLD
ncbi:cytochrome c oxidase subunit 7B [Haematobia irritans]|uniref:Deltamethrin resistance protein prag01 domain-containing protein n=1 Tax=Haematobia irritans TaxID=7368 RepID=A0A1L8EF57_HAEIR